MTTTAKLIEIENRILSIGSEYLPPLARRVRDRDETLTEGEIAAYREWLDGEIANLDEHDAHHAAIEAREATTDALVEVVLAAGNRHADFDGAVAAFDAARLVAEFAATDDAQRAVEIAEALGAEGEPVLANYRGGQVREYCLGDAVRAVYIPDGGRGVCSFFDEEPYVDDVWAGCE